MISDFIDLVLAKQNNNNEIIIVKAPKFSRLKDGDHIIIEKDNYKIVGTVQMVVTLDLMSEEMNFIIKAFGNKPLTNKVRSKIVYDDFHYPEDEEGEKENE